MKDQQHLSINSKKNCDKFSQFSKHLQVATLNKMQKLACASKMNNSIEIFGRGCNL